MEGGKYVPIRIDLAKLPLGFGEHHVFDLTGWDRSPDHGGWMALRGRLDSPTVLSGPFGSGIERTGTSPNRIARAVTSLRSSWRRLLAPVAIAFVVAAATMIVVVNEWNRDNNYFKAAFNRSAWQLDRKVAADPGSFDQRIDELLTEYERSRTGIFLGIILSFVPNGPHAEAVHDIATSKHEFRRLETQMADQKLRIYEFCRRMNTRENIKLVVLTFQANIREASGKAQPRLSNIDELVVSPGEQLSDLISHCLEEITGARPGGVIRSAVLSNSPPQ
jgi:hypothetical protein